jgi:hypothetical protein
MVGSALDYRGRIITNTPNSGGGLYDEQRAD